MILGSGAALLLSLLASQAFRSGSAAGAIVGVGGAIAFGMMALMAWRRLRCPHPPLVLDDDGLAVDDGLGESWQLEWTRIEKVELERGRLGRRIVLVLRGEVEESISLPKFCHGDAPAEWVAGMIETFRDRASRGSAN